MTKHEIHIITWAVLLLFLITVLIIMYKAPLTGKVTEQDVRLGYAQTLQTCSSNKECRGGFYCQPYDRQGTPISAGDKFIEFGLCLPAKEISARH